MSWKQYGGMKKSDQMPNINTVSIATDLFTMRKAYQGLFTICGELHVSQRFENGRPVGANLFVDNNIYLAKQLCLGGSSTFIQGNAQGVGINVSSPQALLDLSTNQIDVIRIITGNSQARNILTQTGDKYGVVFDVDPDRISLDFYHALSPIGQPPESSIVYAQNQMYLAAPQVIIGNSDPSSASLVVNNSGPLISMNDGVETFFSPTIHCESKVNPLSTWSNSGSGWSMGGGTLLGSPMGSMGTVEGNVYVPHHVYIKGNTSFTRTRTGINTYRPSDSHAMDINGPLRLQHSELHVEAEIADSLSSVSIHAGNVTILTPSNSYFFNGKVTKGSALVPGTQLNKDNWASPVKNQTISYSIGGNKNSFSHSLPEGANVLVATSSSKTYFAFSGTSSPYYIKKTSIQNQSVSISCEQVFAMDLNGELFGLAGTRQNKGCIDFNSSHVNPNINKYTAIKIFDSSFAIAVGSNYISVYRGTWTDSNIGSSNNYVDIYDDQHAIVVGDAVWLTRDGGSHWSQVTSIGSENISLLTNIVQVAILDPFSFRFVVASDIIRIIYVYAPSWFSSAPSLLDISGHCTLDGDLLSNLSTVHAWEKVSELYLGGNVHASKLQLENLYLKDRLAMSIDDSISSPIRMHRDVTISGNLQILGNCNIITADQASFVTVDSSGIIQTLKGTAFPQFSTNSNGGSSLGAGFFINWTTNTDSPEPPYNHPGFVKISNQSGNCLSFRSTEDQRVVAMVFPKLEPAPNANSMLLLNTINDVSYDEVTDNYGIISSRYGTLPISVKASFIDVVDVSMTGNVIFQSQTIQLENLVGLNGSVQGNLNALFTKVNANIVTSELATFNAGINMNGNLTLNGNVIPLSSLVGFTGNLNTTINEINATVENKVSLTETREVIFGNIQLQNVICTQGNITSEELSYLKDAKTNIQNQIDLVRSSLGLGGTNTALEATYGINIQGNCTLKKNVILANGVTITQQELSCLQNVSGNIQTQLDNKVYLDETRDIVLGNVSLTKLVGNVLVGNSIAGNHWSITNGNATFVSLQGFNSALQIPEVQIRLCTVSGNAVLNNVSMNGNVSMNNVSMNGNVVANTIAGNHWSIKNGNAAFLTIQGFTSALQIPEVQILGNCTLQGNVVLSSGTVISQQQLTYLQNMTGNIQTQINDRVSLTESGNVSLNNVSMNGNVVANTIAGSNWSIKNGNAAFLTIQGFTSALQIPEVQILGNCTLQGNVVLSSGTVISKQQLTYLQNMTGNIQAQINDRVSLTESGNVIFTGNVTANKLVVSGIEISSGNISAQGWNISSSGDATFKSFSTTSLTSFNKPTLFSQGIKDNDGAVSYWSIPASGKAIFSGIESGAAEFRAKTAEENAIEIEIGSMTIASGGINVNNGTIKANIFNQTSSIRYKKNIEPLCDDYNLEMLMKYKPVTYDLKIGNHPRQIGFIVEDLVEMGANHFVSLNEEGMPDALDYSRITVHLVKCIQELSKKVERLEKLLIR